MRKRPSVLTQTLDLIRVARGHDEVPVVVFDLDHTLYDNGVRTWHILCEFARDCGDIELLGGLEGMCPTRLPYAIAEVLARAGRDDEACAADARRFWSKRFFSNDYLRYDVPMPGAQAFVQATLTAGATVVYLSGRDAPNMLLGTVASLQHHRFPIGLARTVVMLKPSQEMPDLAFKTEVIEFIGTLGHVVATFDNEPANCNAFHRTFPGVLCVWLDTAHSPHAPKLDRGMLTLQDFRRG